MTEPDQGKLKDYIVVAVSVAVKNLQLLCISSKDGPTDTPKIISNSNLLLHDFCIQLERAFCHGLRADKSGFWKYLIGVIPKKIVQEINGLGNVSTDIGKGRAWLHLTLTENSLESYLRLFAEQNNAHKRKYYHRYALLFDIERLQLLETVASGLDLIQFTLDVDVPYMDSVDYSAPFVSKKHYADSNDSKNVDNEQESSGSTRKKVLTSMGYVSCVVNPGENPSAVTTENISTKKEFVAEKQNQEKDPRKGNPSVKPAQIPSILQASTAFSDHMDDTVVSRNRKKKKSKSSLKITSQDGRQKLVKSGGDKSRSNITFDDSPHEGLPKHETSGKPENNVNLFTEEMHLNSTDCIPLPLEEEVTVMPIDNLPVETDNLKTIPDADEIKSLEETVTIITMDKDSKSSDLVVDSTDDSDNKGKGLVPEDNQPRHDSINTELLASPESEERNGESEMCTSVNEPQIAVTDSLKNITIASDKDIGNNNKPEIENLSSISPNQNITTEVLLNDERANIPSSKDNEISAAADNIASEIEKENSSLETCILESSDSSKQETNLNLPTSDVASDIVLNEEAAINISDNDDNNKAEKSENSVLFNECSDENILAFDFDISITPSIELELTLNIIEEESENLCKMYKVPCFENATFVNFQYLVLTDNTIYFLDEESESYTKNFSIEFDNIDHLVVGIDWQHLGIALKSAHYHKINIYTLSELHGRAMIDEIKKSLSNRGLEPLIIYDKIDNLNKWLNAVEEETVEDNSVFKCIQFYCTSKLTSRIKPRKSSAVLDGWLEYYKPQGYFGRGQSWFKQYFCIQDQKLYHWSAKGDKYPKTVLDLKECAECNLISDNEKPFAFKIKMKDGSTSFSLAAHDGESLRLWLTLLYDCIPTQNVWDKKNNAPCVGFVFGTLVITKTRIYICTANAESELLKVLASCPIENISSVSKSKDGQTPYCCSLEYIIMESDESYSIPLCFASSLDCNKLISCITKEWHNLFKVDLTIGECDDDIIDIFGEYVELFGKP